MWDSKERGITKRYHSVHGNMWCPLYNTSIHQKSLSYVVVKEPKELSCGAEVDRHLAHISFDNCSKRCLSIEGQSPHVWDVLKPLSQWCISHKVVPEWGVRLNLDIPLMARAHFNHHLKILTFGIIMVCQMSHHPLLKLPEVDEGTLDRLTMSNLPIRLKFSPTIL